MIASQKELPDTPNCEQFLKMVIREYEKIAESGINSQIQSSELNIKECKL